MTLQDFHDHARIWVYPASRPFSNEEVDAIGAKVQAFTQQWVSHNRQLKAGGGILHGRFLVLVVDEAQADASGCSIDASVHFVQALGHEYGVDFFDRMLFTYWDGEGVQAAHSDDFRERYAKGDIDSNTLVFNPLVKDVGEWKQAWQLPLAQSWHKNFVD